MALHGKHESTWPTRGIDGGFVDIVDSEAELAREMQMQRWMDESQRRHALRAVAAELKAERIAEGWCERRRTDIRAEAA